MCPFVISSCSVSHICLEFSHLSPFLSNSLGQQHYEHQKQSWYQTLQQTNGNIRYIRLVRSAAVRYYEISVFLVECNRLPYVRRQPCGDEECGRIYSSDGHHRTLLQTNFGHLQIPKYSYNYITFIYDYFLLNTLPNYSGSRYQILFITCHYFHVVYVICVSRALWHRRSQSNLQFNISKPQWRKMFQITFQSLKDTKIHYFQFRLIHCILGTNC